MTGVFLSAKQQELSLFSYTVRKRNKSVFALLSGKLEAPYACRCGRAPHLWRL